MTKIGVIGANGQVGAELCLMLAQRSDVDLVAICRTHSGSAFLRWQGIACRHGRTADPNDVARLIGDCDVIVNSSLAGGSPANIRRTEDCIVRNLFTYSKPGATIIHFSTQSVYGDPRPNRLYRRRNPYGRAKLATEHRVRAEQRRSRKSAYILRLGHVCGTMQEISNTIRDSIRASAVVLPSQDCSSNTVYTAAIVGAILQIAAGRAKPGSYDLMSSPPWTWREVYEYEARICRVALTPQIAAESAPVPRRAAVLSPVKRLAASIASSEPMRELASKLLAYAPNRVNARAMGWWYLKRARSQIAALDNAPRAPEHLSWVANGVNFFPAEKSTKELLLLGETESSVQAHFRPWPADLPDANAAT